MEHVSGTPKYKSNTHPRVLSTSMVFLAGITLIVLFVLLQVNRFSKTETSTDMRAKAYVQTETGMRIEAEDMILEGKVAKDPTGTYLIFGP